MHGALATALNPTQFDVSQEDRYKQLDAFMKANPGKVKNMVGHSEGSAVIDNWIRNNSDWKKDNHGFTARRTMTYWVEKR